MPVQPEQPELSRNVRRAAATAAAGTARAGERTRAVMRNRRRSTSNTRLFNENCYFKINQALEIVEERSRNTSSFCFANKDCGYFPFRRRGKKLDFFVKFEIDARKVGEKEPVSFWSDRW